MELHHMRVSTVGRAPLFPGTGPRREALRVLVRVAGSRLWLFALGDDGAQAVVEGPSPRRLGGALALAFAALPQPPALTAAWAEPVEGREHLRRLAGRLLRLPEATGSWEGTCFFDLVGARRIVGFDPTAWRRGLPREDERMVWEAVGIARPAGIPLRGQSLDVIVASAARAVAADPALRGKRAEVVRARRVAIALAREAGFTASQIAGGLQCDADTVWRLGACCDPDDLLAARRGLAIDAALAHRPSA